MLSFIVAVYPLVRFLLLVINENREVDDQTTDAFVVLEGDEIPRIRISDLENALTQRLSVQGENLGPVRGSMNPLLISTMPLQLSLSRIQL